jgi:hypothetical protein
LRIVSFGSKVFLLLGVSLQINCTLTPPSPLQGEGDKTPRFPDSSFSLEGRRLG